MKLLSVEIDHFKNVLKSGPIAIQPDVTCIVGKNESGKTAVLQAIHRFKPAQPNVKFNAQRQYPAWLEKQHRRTRNIEVHVPVAATFQMEDVDIAAVEEQLGPNALKSKQISISTSYANRFTWSPPIQEHAVIAHITAGVALTKSSVPTKLADLDALIEKFNTVAHADESATLEARSLGTELSARRAAVLGGAETTISDALWKILSPRIPKFFYFDEYSQLPGTVKIKELLAKDQALLTPAEATARAFLELGGADNEYLLNPDYETRKRELENIANLITHEVLTYWSTNPELRTDVDVSLKQEQRPDGQHQVLDELKIRLYDNRHMLSLPLEERSTGFRWFFSFLAAFSAYENDETPVVILLDEPGLGLHARAQADFLRFIDERLSKKCQVIYSTHSPFMVQPGKLERVRLVQDAGRAVGSSVTDNVLSSDRDTLFPLQGALGYDMVQHLFIAPHNLIVEGTSDFTYISLLSSFLTETGRTGLDPKWSVIPVGGADLIPSFVALLGHHLEVTVLVDSRKEGHQRLQQLEEQGILKGTRLIGIGSIIETKLADIEDLFTPDDYLKLINAAFEKNFTAAELVGKDPLVRRSARLLGVERYDHGKPATILLKNYAKILPKLSAQTISNFEKLFTKINATIGA